MFLMKQKSGSAVLNNVLPVKENHWWYFLVTYIISLMKASHLSKNPCLLSMLSFLGLSDTKE